MKCKVCGDSVEFDVMYQSMCDGCYADKYLGGER